MGDRWIQMLDTAQGGFVEDEKEYGTREELGVESRPLILMLRKQ